MKNLGVLLCFVITCIASWCGGTYSAEHKHKMAQLTDMYLKPPPGQMQGMDANDLAVRQAWTSSVLRQSAMKVQGNVQALALRVVKLEDANDAD